MDQSNHVHLPHTNDLAYMPSPIGSSASTSQSPGCDSSTTPTPTTWSSTLKPVTIKPFQSPVGPTAIISTSPLEVYHLFFTDNLREEIVEQTNRYAEQGMEDEQYQRWKKVTVEELEAFLGFYILMAINQLPSIEDYWRRDPTTHYSPIADRMSRDRFREISRYLHFSDNTTLVPRGAPGHNRLGKVRPVLDYLCQQFAEQYQPNRDVAVDEAMIKFQGRSSLKQYMPLKPVKRGIKVWVLGDSANGYFSRFEVYTGKEGNTVQTGLGARVVKTLTQEIKHKNHHVYFDNFFTTYQLLEDLLAVVIYACGTARSDRRGFPAELRLVKLKTRYEYVHVCVYVRTTHEYTCVHSRTQTPTDIDIHTYVPYSCTDTNCMYIHVCVYQLVCVSARKCMRECGTSTSVSATCVCMYVCTYVRTTHECTFVHSRTDTN